MADSDSLTSPNTGRPGLTMPADDSPAGTPFPDLPMLAAVRGRFAPSPSGPLHEGSLLAALASYLDARARGGEWLVRMEDLDPPREQPGAADLILRQLDTLGLHWDGSVLYQSKRLEAYREALETLEALDMLYYCTCTRQQLRGLQGRYPGLCRHRRHSLPGTSVRCRLDESAPLVFNDLFQGQQQQSALDEGDVVLLRKDGLFAYQLAVVVDDAWQGINRVVRGIDLLTSTVRQRALQGLLQYPAPTYGHIPVLVDHLGHKLSKQQGAKPVNTTRPEASLVRALATLRQQPPPDLASAPCDIILDWAVSHWRPSAIAGLSSLGPAVPA